MIPPTPTVRELRDWYARSVFRILVGLWFLVIALPASAESVARAEHVGSLHVTMPYFGYTIVDRGTTYGGFGIAAGVLLDRTWLVEAGAMAASHGEDESLLSVVVRGGVMPTLVDSADIEGGWTINAGPWLGYRYDVRQIDDGDRVPTEKVHSIVEGVSVDVTRWWPSEVGLSLRLDLALVSPFARSEDEVWRARIPQSRDFHHGRDIRGYVGVAF